MMVDLLNNSADNWWSVVVHATWQSTIVAMVVLAIVWFGKRLPATLRYMLVMVALAKFLTPPFLVVPIGLFSQIHLHDGSPAPPALPVPDTAIASSLHFRFADTETILPLDNPARIQPIPVIDQGGRSLHAKAVGNPLPRTEPTRVSTPGPGWRAWLMIAHGTGSLTILIWLSWHACKIRGIARHSQIVTHGPLWEQFRSMAHQLGLGRPARLLLSSRPITPLAFGVLQPTVLVPAALMKQVSLSDQRAILAHELSHLRRYDPCVVWLQGLLLVCWWCNPVAWLLNRVILRLREECCDDRVILEGFTNRADYCGALIRAVESCTARTRISGLLASQMHPLQGRIARVMDDRVGRSATLSRTAWACAVLLGLILLPGPGFSTAVEGDEAAVDETDSVTQPPVVNDRVVNDPGVVAGVVVDQTGSPLRAVVWLRTRVDDKSRFESTTTNGKGEFRFAGVAPTNVTLTAVSRGRSFSGMHDRLHEGRSLHNLKLVATSAETLRFSVTDEAGDGVEGAELSWIFWKTPDTGRFWLPLEVLDREKIPRPKSDASGLIEVPGIPQDAQCNLLVKHPEYAQSLVEGVSPAEEPGKVVLVPGNLITVRAVEAETGRPASDATVSIHGSPKSANVSREPVDHNGEFKIQVPKSDRRLTIRVNHPERVADRWASLGGAGDRYPYEFKLFGKGKVRGRVVDAATGRPQAGVRIKMTNRAVRQVIGYGASDAEGAYEMSGPAGNMELSVLSGNGFFEESRRGVDVTMVSGETVVAPDLASKPLPTIRGIVMASDGRPLANALVSNRNEGSHLTGADGRFEFQPQRKEFHYQITANHMTERFSSGVVLSFDEAVSGKEVRIQVEPESEIRGRIVDARGGPLAGVRLELSAVIYFGPKGQVGRIVMESRMAATVTDKQGQYRFVGLSRHLKYLVTVGDPFSRSRPRSEEIELNQPVVNLDPIEVAEGIEVEKAASDKPEAAPELQCSGWINSAPLTLESLRGKVVLLNLWAIWREPSVAKLPTVQLAHELFKDRGLVVIGLHDNSASRKVVREFAQQRGLTYPIALDTEFGETFARYDGRYFPSKILIDRNGKIAPNELVVRPDLLTGLRRVMLYGER